MPEVLKRKPSYYVLLVTTEHHVIDGEDYDKQEQDGMRTYDWNDDKHDVAKCHERLGRGRAFFPWRPCDID